MEGILVALANGGIGYFVGAFLGSLLANAIITARNRRKEKEEED